MDFSDGLVGSGIRRRRRTTRKTKKVVHRRRASGDDDGGMMIGLANPALYGRRKPVHRRRRRAGEGDGDGDGEGGIYRINYRQPKTKKGAISARAAAKIKFINILVKRGFTKTAALAEWRLEEKLPDRCNLRKMLLNPPEKTKRGRKAKGDGGMIVGGMPVAGRARGIRAIKKNPWLTFVKNEGPRPKNWTQQKFIKEVGKKYRGEPSLLD